MQSQQKRVKWSRGETADALEERTDTGITQVSVSKMENVVADIYGNISRRPAFKLTPFATGVSDLTTAFPSQITQGKLVPFKITEDDFVLFIFPTELTPANMSRVNFYRIKNGQIVYSHTIADYYAGVGKVYSYTQHQNYLIVAGSSYCKKYTATNIGTTEITFSEERFIYSGNWHAPEGTENGFVDSTELSGLSMNSTQEGAVSTLIEDTNGIENNLYAAISTGLKSTTANIERMYEKIPVGTIITLPKVGCSLRVEGYTNEVIKESQAPQTLDTSSIVGGVF